MLISENWLRQYLDCSAPLNEILDKLVKAGVPVESVKAQGKEISKVVVGELLDVQKHPQADRLSVTKVSTGAETFQVVCGAKNIAPGQKVPFAKVGAVLPGNFAIKAAKIRNVESFGMLCSASELGLAEKSDGIFILSQDAPVGEDFLKYMGLPDTLFELEIFPNRSDLLSHLGVAREISALFNCPLRFPENPPLPEKGLGETKKTIVSVQSPEGCPLYSCRVLEGVTIGPSPRWLSSALEHLGQHSINNVVDVTNFVMLEMGQPLHAFDYDKLSGSQIVVRMAKKGEKIPLLDNTLRDLQENMLVIADAEKPVALAGIMGGSNSQVLGETKNLLLESALFHPGTIRKTARLLSLSTDSSYRFERGVDSSNVEKALNRAAQLILEVAGGTLGLGPVVQKGKMPTPAVIDYRPERAEVILGIEIPKDRQVLILKNLGCSIENQSQLGVYRITVPSSRLDLTREIDLIEEVARVAGYDLIQSLAPKISSHLSPIGSAIPFENETRFLFHQNGFYEAVNPSFLPPDYIDRFRLAENHPLREHHSLLNPIAEDQKVLRPSLLPSLLANIRLNLAFQQPRVALYELNKVFRKSGNQNPVESYQAVAVVAGLIQESVWTSRERPADYYDAKGLAESWILLARLQDVKWEFGGLNMPYQSAESFRVFDPSGRTLIWGGVLSPRVLKNYDIHVSVTSVEFDLSAFGQSPVPKLHYRPLPRFPEAWRDIALVVPDGVTSNQVLAEINELKPAHLVSMALFDQYRGQELPEGTRSLAFRLRFRHTDQTLNDAEVNDSVSKMLSHLKERFSIAIR